MSNCPDMPENGSFHTKLMEEYSAFRNHNRIIFEEMSSWTALTWNLGMKATFYL